MSLTADEPLGEPAPFCLVSLLRGDEDSEIEVVRGALDTITILLARALPEPEFYDFMDGVFYCGGDWDGGLEIGSCDIAPYTLRIRRK